VVTFERVCPHLRIKIEYIYVGNKYGDLAICLDCGQTMAVKNIPEDATIVEVVKVQPMDEEQKKEAMKKVYLGDGLYAHWDGYQIYLEANVPTTDSVALDRHVLKAFLNYVDRLTDLINGKEE
jgi:hypothetical protein